MDIQVLKKESAARANLRAARMLSIVVAVLAVALSAAGLAFPSLYRDKNALSMSLGNDLITLAVAVPVLVFSLIYSARGSTRATMIWLGGLYYMFYNYAFYVFAIPVTVFYLPWIAVFTLSGFALALGLTRLDIASIGRRFGPRTPARLIALYMFYVAVMVGNLWLSQWVKFLATGTVPALNGDPNAYRAIAAVDLSVMVSLLIPAGFLLWKHRPWGYVLAVMLQVQGPLYLTVMIAVCLFGWLLTPGSQLLSAWFVSSVVSCAVCLLCLTALLRNFDRAPAAG